MTASAPAPGERSRLRHVVLGVVAAGAAAAAVGVVAAARTDVPPAWRLALVLAAFAAGDAALIHLRFGHDQWSFTWSEAVVVVSLVLLPAPWAGLAAGAGVAAAHLARRRPLLKVAFNAGTAVLGVALARGTFLLVAGPDPALSEAATWIGLVVGSLAYGLTTTALISAAVAASQSLSFAEVHRRALPVDLLVCVGNTALGSLLVVVGAYQPLGLIAFPVLLAVLALAYHGYLQTLGERDTWQRLQAVSRDLLVADADRLAQVALDGAVALLSAGFADLVLVDDEAGRTMVGWRSAGPGEPLERIDGDPFERCAGHWGRVVSDRSPFTVDLASASGLQRAELEALGLATVQVTPLLVQGRCLGALRVGFRGPVKLRARERQVLETYANHVSAAASTVRLFDRLRSMALYDGLTGLPNRAELTSRLRESLDASDRVAVLFLDLDRFKVVNDSLGHQAGDRVLQEAARRLRAALPAGATAGRFGGDEFVVIVPGCRDEAEASAVADRIAASLAEPVRVDGRELLVTASIGVVAPGSTASAAGVLRDADAAMYLAKERGRDRCEVFTASVRTSAVRRLEVEHELRRAIDRDELVLHVQPIVDLRTSRMSGVEALVRWQHPLRGLVPPGEFVPLAEETGLILPLGGWVLRTALRDLGGWSRSVEGTLDVSINLAARQLASEHLVDEVLDALEASGASPRRLVLEVTESSVVDLGGAAVSNLTALRAAGARVALDDFGTGFSSLSYLRSLPVDCVKLDRSFVARLDQDARDRAVVGSMVQMAHALDLNVVAEGVEREAQLEVLVGLGCDAAQGYLLQRPGPAAEVLPRAAHRLSA